MVVVVRYAGFLRVELTTTDVVGEMDQVQKDEELNVSFISSINCLIDIAAVD
jgi:hypothetical protein